MEILGYDVEKIYISSEQNFVNYKKKYRVSPYAKFKGAGNYFVLYEDALYNHIETEALFRGRIKSDIQEAQNFLRGVYDE